MFTLPVLVLSTPHTGAAGGMGSCPPGNLMGSASPETSTAQ